MIVRTYQRRSRNVTRGLECEEDGSSYHCLGSSSAMDSNNSWQHHERDREKEKEKGGGRGQEGVGQECPRTASLMEAQESGEMMEHVDEANFALDGLRAGQPLRIQRASLLSLLSIFTSAQHRRLLRTQGLAKSVLDAIVNLSADDPPTALGAAALFYVLASDGRDEYLLDSPICIQFLLKLLFPSFSESSEKKPSVGSKLVGAMTESSLWKVPASVVDLGGGAITLKVQKLLSSMKETHVGSSEEDEDRDCFLSQEMNSKLLALLTLEKACLSTVALEDTSGSVRRVGGHFKERLRELGGLDAVCDVAVSCFSFLKEVQEEEILNTALISTKTTEIFASVRMLLKCMKVMENATFLSELNQKHLLEMNLKLKSKELELSLITLVNSTIKILSELLLKHKLCCSVYEGLRKSSMTGNCDSQSSKSRRKTIKGSKLSSTVTVRGEELTGNKMVPSSASAQNVGRGHHKTVKLSGLRDGTVFSTISEKIICTSVSSSKHSVEDSDSICSLSGKMLHNNGCNNSIVVDSKKRGSASIRGGSQLRSVRNNAVRMDSIPHRGKQYAKAVEQIKNTCSEDLQDPFMFTDEDPASINLKQKNKPKKLKGLQSSVIRMDSKLEYDDVPQCSNDSMDVDSVNELCNHGNQASKWQQTERCALLGDCLLSAVKVLMNLTNDNPTGCHQVARCGGLDTMASLIIDHYPLFQSRLFYFNEQRGKETCSESAENGCSNFNQIEEACSDQDLDLLVVILGVLVNLVEKDTGNRARLAALSVVLRRSPTGHSEIRECRRSVIPLLCSIFLTKQGAGEAVEGGTRVVMESNDEATIKQGQREAENMIVEAYAALLLGFLSKESENARHAISLCLPGRNLKVLVPVLERFVAFHLSLNMISSETHASVADIIESCKHPF